MSDDIRPTQLARLAGLYREFEAVGGGPSAIKADVSRNALRRDAKKLGYADSEIDAAVDAALKTARGST